MRILLLGGTGEARQLAEALSRRPEFATILSFAGRTEIGDDQPVPFRVGGFGGTDGLAAYLRAESIGAVIDATHPFAARISENAYEAAMAEGVALLRFIRAAWLPAPGEIWLRVPSVAAAAAALGETPKRVLLTIGRTELAPFADAPQHRYLIRSIGRPDGVTPPDARFLLDRPPFTEPAERELMRREAIDILVTKNSGGDATRAKLAAARALGVSVVMVERPVATASVASVHSVDEALRWLGVLQAERGV